MADFEVASDKTGFPIRPLPGATRWILRITWAATAAGAGISVWLSSFIPFFLGLGIAGVVYLLTALSVRCPQCRRGLVSRTQEEGPGRERAYYDCPDCRVTWKSEITHEDD